MSSDRIPRASTWRPLRENLFRALWIASIVSSIGTWMQDVGAAWLMISLAPSPTMVALVQTSTSLPFFFLALPAGALADIVDRRRLLLFSQSWMLVAAVALGSLTLLGATAPWVLLALTFILGIGAAMNMPVWQAIIPELVPRDQLPSALTLNSLGVNSARAIGPVLGGFIVAAAGPAIVFLLNGVSFIGVILTLYRWRRPSLKSVLPAERVIGAMRAGIRYVRYSPALKGVLTRSGTFILFGSVLWALLPLLVRLRFARGAAWYGILLGFFGIGAIAGAISLPYLRERMSINKIAAAATVLFACAMIMIGVIQTFYALLPVMIIAGATWLTLLSLFNASIQTALPPWVRGRGLALSNLIFFGGSAIGSALWGKVASLAGIPVTLMSAGSGLIVGLMVTTNYRLAIDDGSNLAPSLHWPTPIVANEPPAEHGPVLVTLEYQIDPLKLQDFLVAMREVQLSRRRGGAIRWGLYQDGATPGRYIETFVVESWIDHLRQHERVTLADRMAEERARSFHLGETTPAVSHFVAAQW